MPHTSGSAADDRGLGFLLDASTTCCTFT